jgi:hypothetical protein
MTRRSDHPDAVSWFRPQAARRNDRSGIKLGSLPCVPIAAAPWRPAKPVQGRGPIGIFVHGFAKSDRDNIRTDELRAFRRLADAMLALDARGLDAAMGNGTIFEVMCDGQAI